MKPGDDKKPLALVDKPHPHAVVKAVQGQDPPGRYLEADKATGGWKEIPYKRSLDKTSQALRERDPNPESGGITPKASEAVASTANDVSLDVLTQATLQQAGLLDDSRQSSSSKAETVIKPAPSKKRKEPEQFQKPSWWSRGTPIATVAQPNLNTMAAPVGMQPAVKRQKSGGQRQEEEAPLPLDALATRQSSFFNFLSNNGLFGGSNKPVPPPPAPTSQSSLMFDNTSSMQMNNNSQQTFDHMNVAASNNRHSFSLQQQQQQYYASGPGGGNDQAAMLQPPKMQERNSLVDVFEPLPIGDANDGGSGISMDQMQVRQQMEMIQRNSLGSRRDSAASNNGIGFESGSNAPANIPDVAAAPPRIGLTAQISDWLTPFLPQSEDAAPPPPGEDLQRSISSTLFNMARSPSQFLTSLKSGVTSMFMDNNPAQPVSMPAPPGSLEQNQSFGRRSDSIKDSLLDDTDESPLETQLRQFPSN
ncbi:MAG: hypothetical protein SGBAC_012453 [Bacillariaceae sp.]